MWIKGLKMSERWTNTANDKGELSEMLIQSLIETAVKQLRFSYTPYSHFKVGAASSGLWMARFIPDAI